MALACVHLAKLFYALYTHHRGIRTGLYCIITRVYLLTAAQHIYIYIRLYISLGLGISRVGDSAVGSNSTKYWAIQRVTSGIARKVVLTV